MWQAAASSIRILRVHKRIFVLNMIDYTGDYSKLPDWADPL